MEAGALVAAAWPLLSVDLGCEVFDGGPVGEPRACGEEPVEAVAHQEHPLPIRPASVTNSASSSVLGNSSVTDRL